MVNMYRFSVRSIQRRSPIRCAVIVALAGLTMVGCGGVESEDSLKVVCRRPGSERTDTVQSWKYDAVREAIIQVLQTETGGLGGKALTQAVDEQLTVQQKEYLGTVSWFVEVVRLEMEVRGELSRLVKAGSTTLILTN